MGGPLGHQHTDIPFVGCNKKASESLWCCISVSDGRPLSNDVSFYPPPLSFPHPFKMVHTNFFSFFSFRKKKIIIIILIINKRNLLNSANHIF